MAFVHTPMGKNLGHFVHCNWSTKSPRTTTKISLKTITRNKKNYGKTQMLALKHSLRKLAQILYTCVGWEVICKWKHNAKGLLHIHHLRCYH